MGIKIQIIGLGYIGLPTAICLAEKNSSVYGCDIDLDKIKDIKTFNVDKNEPNLQVKLKSVYESSLHISSKIIDSDVYIICVPTPFLDDKTPDLSFIINVVNEISPRLKKGDLVVLESTAPIGTTHTVRDIIKKNREDLNLSNDYDCMNSDVNIAYCPERVLPGNIFQELYQNDRVIGGVTRKCSQAASKVYKLFVKGNISFTDSNTAEFVKLAENTYRDINIAIANEFSMMADNRGLDIQEIISITNKHPRVDILKPGVGVGGHCLAVDPYFLAHSFPKQSSLTLESRRVNLEKENFSYKKIINFIRANEISTLCLFGISYKPNSNDLRESPSYRILKKLLKSGTKVNVCEPNIDSLGIDSKICNLISIEEAIEKSDGLVFLVPHKEFHSINRESLRNPYLDFCNLFRQL